MHPCVNDVNDGCLAMGGGTTERRFRFPGRNSSHDLCNASQIL